MTNEYPLNVSEMTSLIDNGNRSGRQTAQSIPVEDKTVAESKVLNRTKLNGRDYQIQDINVGRNKPSPEANNPGRDRERFITNIKS